MRSLAIAALSVSVLGATIACKKNREEEARRPPPEEPGEGHTDILHLRTETSTRVLAEAAPPRREPMREPQPIKMEQPIQAGDAEVGDLGIGGYDSGIQPTGSPPRTATLRTASLARTPGRTATMAETPPLPGAPPNPYALPGEDQPGTEAERATSSGNTNDNTSVSARLSPRGASTMQGIATAVYDRSGNATLTVQVIGGVDGVYVVRLSEGTGCSNSAGAAPEVYTGQVGLDGGGLGGWTSGLAETVEAATAMTIGQIAVQDGNGRFDTSISGFAAQAGAGAALTTRKILIQQQAGSANPQLGDTSGYVSCGVITLLNSPGA